MMTAMVLSILIGLATATPSLSDSYPSSSHSHVPSGHCTDYRITVPIISENFIWAPPPFQNNFDVVDWQFNTSRKDSQQVWVPFSGTKKMTKDYTIAGTFCSPKHTKDGKETTVLLATSGLAYDGRYWAPTYKAAEYSFVEFALKSGYSVFWYDRIGTGKSQKERGYVAQAAQAIQLVKYLGNSIKAGKYTDAIVSSKLVLVGHSFGSYSSNAAVVLQPDLADAVVVTGLGYPNLDPLIDPGSRSQSWGPTAFAARIASTVDPKAWPSSVYDTGYVIFRDIYSHVDTFFREYEKDVAEYAQTIAQPLAVTELTSLGTLDLNATEYKGKVLVAAGQYDLLLCGGECYSTFQTGLQEEYWKAASVLETYIHSGAGHGVNFNKNATGFYSKIVEFLDRHL